MIRGRGAIGAGEAARDGGGHFGCHEQQHTLRMPRHRKLQDVRLVDMPHAPCHSPGGAPRALSRLQPAW
eukprot:6874028-Prymnesium_polylepis.1